MAGLLPFAFAQVSRCVPSASSCAFYTCVEQSLQCERGPRSDSYLIQYGLKYCERFSSLRLDAVGTRWTTSTKLCLQQRLAGLLRSNPRPSCAALTSFAFASHPACYTQPSSSVCDLSIRTQARISTTVDTSDLLTRRSVVQVGQVAQTCARRIINRGIESGQRVLESGVDTARRGLHNIWERA